MTMLQMRNVALMTVSMLLATWVNIARADSEVPASALAGSWIVDAGPNQIKTVTSYTPIGGGQFAAVESVFNLDWSLGGAMPTATHASTLNGIVEKNKKDIDFVLITYALDDNEKAVYILKAVGNKVLKDKDTISVENLVFQIYTDPENENPVTDTADFTIPPSGTFPPVREYRIKLTN
jgi:hypothetical protein